MRSPEYSLLREAIEKTVEKHAHDYSFVENSEGFKLYFCHFPFHFDFKREKVGWTVALISKPHEEEVSYQDVIRMYEEFISLIQRFNKENKGQLTSEKLHLSKHLEEIDRFFYSFKDLLASKHQTDQTVYYTFKKTKEQLVQPVAAIHYIESEHCWRMNVFGFNEGPEILPPYDTIYQKSQHLLFRLNSELQ